jgi:hypothetical protein
MGGAPAAAWVAYCGSFCRARLLVDKLARASTARSLIESDAVVAHTFGMRWIAG